MTTRTLVLLLASVVFPCGASTSHAQADKAALPAKPLKVFILAGQSNMQGHASVSTFDSLADDPKTIPLLKEMRDKDGKPKVCDRLWITSVGCLGNAYDDLQEQTSKLTAGFGAGGKNNIGPEFTFGLSMRNRSRVGMIRGTIWPSRKRKNQRHHRHVAVATSDHSRTDRRLAARVSGFAASGDRPF